MGDEGEARLVHQENWKILNLPFLPFLACGKSKKYTFSKYHPLFKRNY
jgi:hypothetical protein